MARTIMIMAGGTGGHVFPALAVAATLRASGWNVVWLGTRTGMEATLVPAAGYEVAWVRFSGLRGRGILAKLLLPMNLLVAFWQSARAIFARRPDVVLGMGGYISFPGGMMASLLNRPLAIHEQNAVAGLANRVLSHLADRVLVSFPETLAHGEFVGNPVRAEIARIAPPAERYAARSGPLRLLVVGGSLGAAALNDVVPKALARIPEATRPMVTHQSGDKHITALRANYSAAGVAAELVPFIEDMAAAYAGADIVICRAGATTVAELAATGVASLLVPFPFAVDDHQTTNARYLVDRGAAILEQQVSLTPDRLAEILGGLTRDALRQMAERARAAARPDATQAVARACMELAK
jgi:UDP-N-acetylglucosamine--N-acetylmuramyl-(pentapeptide) pyrophosphoryl-undecaprenol N-acetylglucosamine transferase